MNKLSKEKRNQLVLATLVILMVLSGLWFTLIRHQQDSLAKLATHRDAVAAELKKVQDTKKNSAQISADLDSVASEVELQEQKMASDDLYSWMIREISSFQEKYNVEIPQFEKTPAAVDVNLLPRFPYQQYTTIVAGTAFYHDIGRFIADYENRFPSSRIVNLELFPSPTDSPDRREKLSFKMEIVSLVRPAGTPRLASTP